MHKNLIVRSLGWQLLAVLLVYSFAWGGDFWLSGGIFFGVFFDIFVWLGFAVLIGLLVVCCLLLSAYGKGRSAWMIFVASVLFYGANFAYFLPLVQSFSQEPVTASAQVSALP